METQRPDTQAARAAVEVLLRYVGEDPERDGLRDTPRRVVRALAEFTEGAGESAAPLLQRTFQCGSDDFVVVSGISFVSLCEHHMLPFTGTAGIAYRPSGGVVVGLSKLARTVDVYARRLQLQERLTRQVADAICSNVSEDVAVVMRASHSCMTHRGAKQANAVMTTSAMLGIFRVNAAARNEALMLLQ